MTTGRRTAPIGFLYDSGWLDFEVFWGELVRSRSVPAQFGVVLFALVMLVPALSHSFEPVRAEIGKISAWTGEAVPLIITLYSPGPFSGTAAFDLPELPQTVFVKTGSPLVGSEDADGESYLTQRHEFTLYTQRSGEIEIPAFRIRFSGKKTFTSDAVSTEGFTPELQFESKRPLGSESMGVVISATSMKIEQTWRPLPKSEIQAGDVIVRTITRNTTGTSAMMLPPTSNNAPKGVQVYSASPEVKDTVERGVASARRVDTIKYQFQRSGRYDLPALTFSWWDPEREKLQSESVANLNVVVAEAKAATQEIEDAPIANSSIWISLVAGVVVIGISAWLIRRPVGQLFETWRSYHHRPEAVAARKLRAACTANDASAAYSALLAWLDASQSHDDENQLERLQGMQEQSPLHNQWRALSRHLFARDTPSSVWDGRQLWAEFLEFRRAQNHDSSAIQIAALPALNPIGSENCGS